MVSALLIYHTSRDVLKCLVQENGSFNQMSCFGQFLEGLLTSKKIDIFLIFIAFLSAFTVK